MTQSSTEWLLEQTEVLARQRRERERQENAGARIADDCHCPGCGARGFFRLCSRCES